jgi:parallel beta-helix repeat protein
VCFIIYLYLITISAVNSWASSSFIVPSDGFKTIAQAFVKAKKGDTIWVEEGVYREKVAISSGVALISKMLHKAVINGQGSEHAVTMGNSSAISGFEITNGRIGLYSEGTSTAILNCFIHNNQQSGIICVGNLPDISDNIIVQNGGSGIQGWDVRSTISTINHNTIAYNKTHGISIGGKSDIIVENNIIVFNERLGLKADPGVRIKLIKNNFYLNGEFLPSLPVDNFSFDPMFVSASLLNFTLSKDSQCRNMATDNKNLGTRILY